MNKKLLTTAFAALWLIVSCVTHAGIIYELDCSDQNCSDDIKLSGSIEFVDGLTIETDKLYQEDTLKGWEMNYLHVASGTSLRFVTDFDNLDWFRFQLDSDGEVGELWFMAWGYTPSGDFAVFEQQLDEIVLDWVGSTHRAPFAAYVDIYVSSPTVLEAVDVPAPHAATILALGVMGLATRRSKKQS